MQVALNIALVLALLAIPLSLLSYIIMRQRIRRTDVDLNAQREELARAYRQAEYDLRRSNPPPMESRSIGRY